MIMKIGFLVVDMQKAFLQDRMKELNVNKACEYINHVANLIRANGHCVIHIQDVEGADELADPELLNFIPEIHVDERDIRITKTASNAFWNTELEQVLLNHDIGLVVVAGFAAEHCVLFTYNGAIERGFKAVMLQNGILSGNQDVINATYRDRHMISHPVIKFMVG